MTSRLLHYLGMGFILICLFGTLLAASQAHGAAISDSWRWQQCRFRSFEGSPRNFSRHEMELTLRCATDHFPVPGGYPKAYAVISCESGWGPYATSPSGQHFGLYQMTSSFFHAWVGPQAWDVPLNVFNPRANILAGTRAAHGIGWGPWTCA